MSPDLLLISLLLRPDDRTKSCPYHTTASESSLKMHQSRTICRL